MAVLVKELLTAEDAGLGLDVVCGSNGLDRVLDVPRIQKPGLALTGYAEQLHPGRLLALGGTEIDYLAGIDEASRKVAYKTIIASTPACVVITRGLVAPDLLAKACADAGVALLTTALTSADFIARVTKYLSVQLAPTCSVHGVLVDVLEIGILLLGKSGIGKSEAALDLVVRGHRLVADDVVRCRLRADGTVVGSSTQPLGHHMEVRGLGIINIADLFGITAIRDVKRIDLVVELSEWNQSEAYDRLGIDDKTHPLLSVELPMVKLPVRPGRNISTLIEVAARNQLLRDVGHHSARDLLAALDDRLARAREEVSE